MLPMIAVLAYAALAVVFMVTYRRERVVAVAACTVLGIFMLVPTLYAGGGLVPQAVLGVALGATAIAAVRRGAKVRGLGLLIAFFAVLLIATLFNPGVSNINLLANAAIPALTMAYLFGLANTAERTVILRFVVVLAVAESIYALLEVARIAPRLWNNEGVYESQLIGGLIRSEGTFAQPLVLALFLLFTLGVLFSKATPVRGGWKFLTVLLMFAGLAATGSRSAIVVGVLFALFSVSRNAVARVLVGLLAGAILVLSLAAAEFFQGNLVLNFITGDSVTHRSGALDAVPRLLTAQDGWAVAFGNGFYSTPSLFRAGLLQSGTFYAIDLQFVSTLAEGGLVALALLFAVIAVALFRGRGALMPLAAVVFFFFTFDVLTWPAGAALFGLALAMRHAATDQAPEELRDSGISSPRLARTTV